MKKLQDVAQNTLFQIAVKKDRVTKVACEKMRSRIGPDLRDLALLSMRKIKTA